MCASSHITATVRKDNLPLYGGEEIAFHQQTSNDLSFDFKPVKVGWYSEFAPYCLLADYLTLCPLCHHSDPTNETFL